MRTLHYTPYPETAAIGTQGNALSTFNHDNKGGNVHRVERQGRVPGILPQFDKAPPAGLLLATEEYPVLDGVTGTAFSAPREGHDSGAGGGAASLGGSRQPCAALAAAAALGGAC